jgi:hypothetical protein
LADIGREHSGYTANNIDKLGEWLHSTIPRECDGAGVRQPEEPYVGPQQEGAAPAVDSQPGCLIEPKGIPFRRCCEPDCLPGGEQKPNRPSGVGGRLQHALNDRSVIGETVRLDPEIAGIDHRFVNAWFSGGRLRGTGPCLHEGTNHRTECERCRF